MLRHGPYVRLWRPAPGMKVFIDDSVLRARWKDLQRLEKLDEGILLGRREALEGATFVERFSRMREHRLAYRGEHAMVKVRRAACSSPQSAREELPISFV